jgi:hypothetical protein
MASYNDDAALRQDVTEQQAQAKQTQQQAENYGVCDSCYGYGCCNNCDDWGYTQTSSKRGFFARIFGG